MDSRGASALSDPDGAFERFIDKHGLDARNLRRARNLTQDRIADVRKKLEAHEWPANSSVVLFGSWGRSELTDRSDDDWALLVCADGVDQDAIDSALEIARRHLGRGTRKPGAQGVFGREIECEKLRTKIGLQEDDNMNLTRRALLLLESREVAGSGHRQCRDRVLERYLEYGLKSNRPPRFLLKDIVRYWRTIAVDFEGKFQEGGGADPKWAERNAKLRTSRKLLFASGLIPVLQCHLLAKDEMADYLRRQLEVSPIDRVVAAFEHYRALDEGVRLVEAYDRWIGILGDDEARRELANLRPDTRDLSPLFAEIREIGETLERSLIALLFDTQLSLVARRYAVF
jgi:hypothetical protein